jgi:hypothetical protein
MNGPEKESLATVEITVGNPEQLCGLGQDLDIVERHQPIMRLHALIHGRLIVDERDRAVLGRQHL